MSIKPKVLIVDDEAPIRDVLAASLVDENYDVSTAANGDEALAYLKNNSPNIVLLDIWMPGSKDGIDVLRLARPTLLDTEFVVMSGHGNIETAVKAVKLGAWDFVEKPLSMEKIFILLTNVIAFQREKKEKLSLLNRLRKNIAIIGEDQQTMKLKQTLARVAAQSGPVLVWGERGSGRELIGQNVHYLSHRAGQPFVELTCASYPEDLLAGEIFGFEKGVYGPQSQKGKLEYANNGTLFIDDVAELPLEIQDKLVRIMKTKKFSRLGGTEEFEVDVRIVCASAQDLAARVKAGTFREELLQKLSAETVKVPNLRERRADIPSLLLHFSELFAKEGGSKLKVFSAEAMEILQGYSWPGNVRELRNFIERIYILTPNDIVNVHDIKFAGLNQVDESSEDPGGMGISNFKLARAQFEKEYILKKLAENGGNVSKTAEVIGLERSHLHRKIKSYGIDVNEMV